MIIVDTSVWIDHLNAANSRLIAILDEGGHRIHPFVVGELALGNLRDRPTVIELPEAMPQAELALHEEFLRLVAERDPYGLGIGYVDANLLASAKLMPGARVWTRDKRLVAACRRLGVSFEPRH